VSILAVVGGGRMHWEGRRGRSRLMSEQCSSAVSRSDESQRSDVTLSCSVRSSRLPEELTILSLASSQE
jgi:hypothetical protein